MARPAASQPARSGRETRALAPRNERPRPGARRQPARSSRDPRSCARPAAPGAPRGRTGRVASTAFSRRRRSRVIEGTVLRQLRVQRGPRCGSPARSGRRAARTRRAASTTRVANGGGVLRPRRPRAGPASRRRHRDVQIDPVEQRDPRACARSGGARRVAGAGRGADRRENRRDTDSSPRRAGRRTERRTAPRARTTETRRSSSGWRIASRTSRRNSGSSSRKRTPR